MGFLARVHERSFTLGPWSLKDPATAKFFSHRPVDAGVSVDEVIALTFSAVWDAVQQISSDCAKLPLQLIKRDQSGARRPYVESKLYKLLHDEPNEEMSAFVFRRAILSHALTWGNGYAEIERDNADRPVALWLLTPDRVEVKREKRPNGELGRLVYRIDAGKTTLEPRDVLHIAGPSFDGVVGYNLINVARQTIGLALASEKHAAVFFANGSTFGGIISGEGDYDEDDIRKAFGDRYQGVNRAHQLAVMPPGHNFQYFKTAVDPQQAQMREILDWVIDDVARFYNMPPHMLKKLDRATNNNIEHQSLEYYKGCVLNHLTGFEQEANRKLISRLEYRWQFFKHNVDALLRADSKTRAEALAVQHNHGVININEWRELEDRNPLSGRQGEMHVLQAQMTPVDRIDAMIDAKLEATKAKANPPAPATPAKEDDDAEVEAANGRAARAEELAEAARADAAAARERLAAAEASLGTTNQELELRRQEVRAAVALAGELQRVADEHRQTADTLRADRDALRTQLTEAERTHQALERRAVEAEERAEQAAATRDQMAAEVREAVDRERLAREAVVAAEAQLAAVREQAAAPHADVAQAIEALSQARTSLDEARRTFTEEALQRAALEQELAAVRTQADTARAEADRLVAEARAAADQARTEHAREAEARAAAEGAAAVADAARAAAEATQAADAAAAAQATAAVETARAEVTQLTAAVAETRAQVETLEAQLSTATAGHASELSTLRETLVGLEHDRNAAAERATALEQQAAAATAAVKQQRASELARMTGMLGALRGLFIDALSRMIRWEADKARRNQASPEKLRTWLEAFYVTHEDTVADALLRAVSVHLAWTQSAEDPALVARRLAREHVAESLRQLRAAAASDPEDLHTTLERMLQRWEEDRPAALADRMLKEEVEYVRSYAQ